MRASGTNGRSAIATVAGQREQTTTPVARVVSLQQQVNEPMSELKTRAELRRRIKLKEASREQNRLLRLDLAASLTRGEVEGFVRTSEAALLRDLLICFRCECEFVQELASLQLKLAQLERDELVAEANLRARIMMGFQDVEWLRNEASEVQQRAEQIVMEIDTIRLQADFLPACQQVAWLEGISRLETEFTATQNELELYAQQIQSCKERRTKSEAELEELESKNESPS